MNGPLHRRSLLAGLSTGVVSTLAGCSVFGDSIATESERYRIGDIRLTSRDPEPHQLDLLIRRDGDIIHWQSYDVRAYDPEKRGGTMYTTVVPATEFGGCTPGVYNLSARLENGTQQTFQGNADDAFDGTTREIRIREHAQRFSVAAGVTENTCESTTSPEQSL